MGGARAAAEIAGHRGSGGCGRQWTRTRARRRFTQVLAPLTLPSCWMPSSGWFGWVHTRSVSKPFTNPPLLFPRQRGDAAARHDRASRVARVELAGQLHGHRRAPGLAAGTSTSAAPRWLAVTLVVSGWLHQVRDLAATGFPKPFHQNCDLVIQETCELGYRFIVQLVQASTSLYKPVYSYPYC